MVGRTKISSLVSVVVVLLFIRRVVGVLDGSVLSTSETESCATLPDGNGGSKTQCQDSTVMQLELRPDSAGGSIKFLFQNTKQSGASGGGQPRCDDKNPGTCVGGNPFFVNINISPMVASYGLDTKGLSVPFGYAHSTCLTRAPFGSASSKAGGPYPDTVANQCGPTITYDTGDYTPCNQVGDFSLDGDADKYSECTMMCSIDKQIAQTDDDNFCANKANYNSLREDYRTTDGNAPPRQHLTCKDVNFDSSFEKCMPNFPDPKNICPCAGGQTTISGSNVETSVYAPITVCKSGTCAGSCGTALKIEPGDWCGGQDNATCCNVTDPKSLCVNTGQLHRCLKCQPAGHEKDKKHYCYYEDLSVELRCSWYGHFSNPTGLDLSAYCGSGDYVEGGWFDPSYNQADSERYRNLNACNCAAGFVEKIYTVAPLCNTYVIRNPMRYEYTVTVYFTDIDDNRIVPGSVMELGSGFGVDTTPQNPVNLPSESMTPDGFALSRIISIDSTTGKKSDDLQGFIVMCNNGADPSCSPSAVGINDTFLPTTNIQTSTPDGRFNPWTLVPNGVFSADEAKVPLPDQLQRFVNDQAEMMNASLGSRSVTEANLAPWFYYVSPALTSRYGPSCGQLGYVPVGDTDSATANRMCNGPIGTCVPGSDTLQYGEAVDPPCNVARDMYDYVVANGGTYADNTDRLDGIKCGGTSGNIRRVPKHVPLDWDPVEPQYTVHNGRLYKYKSPTFSLLNLRMSLSIAADFQGEIITQAPGSINDEPRVCVLYISQGIGNVQVSVDNKGAQAAEYTLTATCTQGIEMSDSNGVTFGQAPGAGGTSNVQTIPLSVRTDAQLTPSQSQLDAGELIPSCNVSLFPSGLVIQGHPLATADLIQCDPILVEPSVLPSVPEIHENGIGITVVSSNYTTCGLLQPFCDIALGGGNNGFFSPLEHSLITFTLMILVFGIVACVIGKMTNAAYGKAAEEDAARTAFERQRKTIGGVKYEAVKELHE